MNHEAGGKRGEGNFPPTAIDLTNTRRLVAEVVSTSPVIVEQVPLDQIKVRIRLRTPKESKVADIAESIKTIGLLNPITIDQDNYIVCGYHRYLAHKLLKAECIDAIRKDFSPIYFEMSEIDENIKRNDIKSYIEFSEHLKRREELLIELGLRKKSGYNKKEDGKLTTNEVAEELDMTNRLYRIKRQIAEKMIEEVRDELRDTQFAEVLMDMVKLSQQTPDIQRKISALLITGKYSTFKRAMVEGSNEVVRRTKDYKIDFNMKERFGIPHSIANFKKANTELQNLCNLVSKDPEVEWVKRDGVHFGETQIPVYQMAADHAEFLINYYVPEGGLVLDQFMGRATNCFASLCSGRRFIGYDVEKKNIDKTNEVINEYLPDFSDRVQLFHSDGIALEELKDKSDYLDACCCDPPYIAQNERYTTDERDLSNMNYKQYIEKMEQNFVELFRLIKKSNFEKKEFYPVIFKVGTGRRGKHGICDMSAEFQYLAKSTGFVVWDLFYNQLNTPWGSVNWERNYLNRYVQKSHESNLVFCRF